jgi:hypothetical protein
MVIPSLVNTTEPKTSMGGMVKELAKDTVANESVPVMFMEPSLPQEIPWLPLNLPLGPGPPRAG